MRSHAACSLHPILMHGLFIAQQLAMLLAMQNSCCQFTACDYDNYAVAGFLPSAASCVTASENIFQRKIHGFLLVSCAVKIHIFLHLYVLMTPVVDFLFKVRQKTAHFRMLNF